MSKVGICVNNDLNLLLKMFSTNGKVDLSKINKAKDNLSDSDKNMFETLINNKAERDKLFSSPEVQNLINSLKNGK